MATAAGFVNITGIKDTDLEAFFKKSVTNMSVEVLRQILESPSDDTDTWCNNLHVLISIEKRSYIVFISEECSTDMYEHEEKHRANIKYLEARLIETFSKILPPEVNALVKNFY